MNNTGFISIHRKMLDWEWFKDINTCYLFYYFLLKANWTDGKFRGISVNRGSFITSLQHISVETGLSIQQIRTSIEKLKVTNEITCKATNKYTLISVVKYNDYQDSFEKINKQNNTQSNKRATNKNGLHKKNIKKNNMQSNKQITSCEEDKCNDTEILLLQSNKQSNKQITNEQQAKQQQYNNINNNNNIINSLSIEKIEKIVREKNYNISIQDFYDCYKDQNVKNLNALLKKWNDNNKVKKTFNNYSERTDVTPDEVDNMNKLYKKYGGKAC